MERALEPQFLLYCQHHKSCIRNIFQFMGYSEMETLKTTIPFQLETSPPRSDILAPKNLQFKTQTEKLETSRFDNYSQKCRWIAVNMYRVAKWRGHLDHFHRLRSNTYHTETKRLVQL